jgi:hypothetical protein
MSEDGVENSFVDMELFSKSPAATISPSGNVATLTQGGTVLISGTLTSKTRVMLKVTIPTAYYTHIKNFQDRNGKRSAIRIKHTPKAFFGVCTASFPLDKDPVGKGSWAFSNSGLTFANGKHSFQNHAHFNSGDMIELHYEPLSPFTGNLQWWLNKKVQKMVPVKFTPGDWVGASHVDTDHAGKLALCVGASHIDTDHAVSWKVTKAQ